MRTPSILKRIFILLCLLVLYSSDYSQIACAQGIRGDSDLDIQEESSDWEVLNPKPSFMPGNEICFVDEQTGFIVTDNELLISRNGGESWDWLMELSSGKDIAFSNSIGYIVGDEGAVYKSTQMGEGWNKLQVGFNDHLNSISVIHSDTVLATGDNNLFISHDGGQSWETHVVPGVDIESSYFTSSDTGHVACRDGSILKTTDGGLNWSITESVNHTPAEFFDICFVNSQLGFASRAHSDLLRTSDGGESWGEVNAYLEAAFDIHFINETNGYLAGLGGSIFKTTDSGISWDWAGFQGLTGDTDLYGIYFLNEDKGFAVGQRGRITRTIDAGETWEDYAPSYNYIHQIEVTPNNTLYALGEKLFKSSDGGQNWDTLNTGVYNQDRFVFEYIDGHFFSEDEFFVIASAGEVSRVVKSTDGGQNFEILTSEGRNFGASSLHFLDQQMGYASNRYDGFWSGLYKTSDGGQSWENLSAHRFWDIWFVDELRGFGILSDKLYQTIDGGLNWEQKVDVNKSLYKIHFPNNDVGYISGEDGLVLKTSDQGDNWQELSTGYGDNFGLFFRNQAVGFVTGKYQALHITANGGSTWETEILPLEMESIFVSADKEVFVTGSNGVILKKLIDVDEDISRVQDLVSQEVKIYPNPARDILNLVIPNAMESVHIYDLSGRKLISMEFHKEVDISNLEPGQYIIKILGKNRALTGQFQKE